MDILGIDGTLDGLRRGAERMGTRVAAAVVRRMARRVNASNGFSPKEQEPYGAGMGGAETQQTGARNASDFSAETKAAQAEVDRLKVAGAPQAEVVAALRAVSAALKREMEASGLAVRKLGNAEPALGFDSAQRTTTAERSKENEDMLSKCPACGHESNLPWDGKCGGCGARNAEDAGGNAALKENVGGTAEVKCPYCAGVKVAVGALADHIRKNHPGVPDPDGIAEGERQELSRRARGNAGSTRCVRCDALTEVDEDFKNPHGAGYLCADCLHEDRLGKPWPAPKKKENAGHVHEDFNFPCDVCGKTMCPSCGGTSDGGTRYHNKDCKAKLRQQLKENGVTGAEARLNAGHLGPDAWLAASLDERAQWLESAGLDLNLATESFNGLSEDVKVALQDRMDMPGSRNNALGKCPNCGGLGEVSTSITCPECRGTGKYENASDNCSFCGHGRADHAGNACGSCDKPSYGCGGFESNKEDLKARQGKGLKPGQDPDGAWMTKARGNASDDNPACEGCGRAMSDAEVEDAVRRGETDCSRCKGFDMTVSKLTKFEKRNGFDSKASVKAERDALKDQLDMLTRELHQIEGQDGAHSHDSEPAVKRILARMQEVEREMEAAHQEYLKAHERGNSDSSMPAFCDICGKRSPSLVGTPDGDICRECEKALDKEMAEYDRGAEAKKNADIAVPESHLERDREDALEIARHAEGIEHEVGEILAEDEAIKNKKIGESEIGEEVAHHIREKGMEPEQAVAAAFSETRQSLGNSTADGTARGKSKYGGRA